MKSPAVLSILVLCVVSMYGNRECLGEKPNVVLVMTDDQGFGDLASHGNRWIKTPNLDTLASQSIRLDDYHVSPYCVPTRAAMLTGRYADRTGVHNALEPHWFVRTSEILLSDMFSEAGYVTGMFGKWHLGDNYPYGPEHRGFGEVLRHYGGAVGVLADYWDNCYVDDTYYRNGKPTKVQGYCTDVFFSAATRFIDNSVEQGKPFFVYLATNAPHGPRICPPSYAKPYAGGKTQRLATFYGMIANIDENVGQLRKYLEDKNIDNNTIFIFATDNGSAGGDKLYNAGMRGSKGSPYDGGHRVPLFLHWPNGGFAEERRINSLTAHIDVAPTLLDLCGISPPEGVDFDGVSLRPLLENGDHQSWPDRIIMTDAQQHEPPKKWATTAVLSERWRLVEGKELYEIDKDPEQKNNVISAYPEVAERLSTYYDALWDELEPTFKDVAEIPLGDPKAKSVALNYHDCIGRHMFWFQDGIRGLQGSFRGRDETLIDPAKSGRAPAFWPVNIVTEGEYTIELRRYPRELNAPINADIPAGNDVHGESGHRSVPGVGFPATRAQLSVGNQKATIRVDKDARAATFQLKLSCGSQRLSARFVAADGRSLDAFYVDVKKSE